jgi:hypothetical protein
MVCSRITSPSISTKNTCTHFSADNIDFAVWYYVTRLICLEDLFLIKPTRCTNFKNLFCHETLHVSDSSSVHHQEFIHCTLSNGVCHTGTVNTAFEQEMWINSWWWTDELSETCRVSWQNKFVKSVHLVGFITKKLVAMHGHTNVKFFMEEFCLHLDPYTTLFILLYIMLFNFTLLNFLRLRALMSLFYFKIRLMH